MADIYIQTNSLNAFFIMHFFFVLPFRGTSDAGEFRTDPQPHPTPVKGEPANTD